MRREYRAAKAFQDMGNSAEFASAAMQLMGATIHEGDIENSIAFSRAMWKAQTGRSVPRYVRRRQGQSRQQARAARRVAYRAVVQARGGL